jgi:hypothetical protein
MTTVTKVDPWTNNEERAKARAIVEAANQEARDRWEDDDFHREFAAVMTTNIFEGFRHENVLSLMTQVETVGLNDRITIREVRGLRVFWVSLGGYIEQSTLRARVMELTKDQVGFHLSENEDKMTANFVESSGEIEDLAIQTMDAAMQVRLISMFQVAIPDTSPYYIEGAGLSLAALDTALTEVEDETELDLPAIIGRAPMVNQIFNDLLASNNFTPETNEQLLRTGVIGIYKGARVIRLRNFKNDIGTPYFPNNELYVVGRDASKFGFWGGLTTKEWVEQGGWYWHLMGRRLAGGALYRPERVRRIVDTSL